MDWHACRKLQFVKDVKIDEHLIASLLASSKRKMKSQALLPLTNDTAASKISLAYDAMRELLEAKALSKGFKLYNHECFCAFLKEIAKKPALGARFDEYRKLRNALNYYGREITAEEAESVLKGMMSLLEELSRS